jgi:NhaP-type Na+/H+ or K+/H+ antiporter
VAFLQAVIFGQLAGFVLGWGWRAVSTNMRKPGFKSDQNDG